MKYNIRDLKTQADIFISVHRITGAALQKAIDKTVERIQKHLGEGSKYRPHQGKKECLRRMKRMAAQWGKPLTA